jgi:hypothetical protein
MQYSSDAFASGALQLHWCSCSHVVIDDMGARGVRRFCFIDCKRVNLEDTRLDAAAAAGIRFGQ